MLKPDDETALCLKPNYFNVRVIICKVVEADDRGVKVVAADHVVNAYVGSTYYFPWDSIASALVDDPSDADDFAERAARFQQRFK